jgi:hypothetical protein
MSRLSPYPVENIFIVYQHITEVKYKVVVSAAAEYSISSSSGGDDDVGGW